MQSKAATVKEYLAELPADRRAAIEAVRNVILKNLDSDYEEGMQYGMMGYYVPHRIFPAGYHCDPRQPLCFVGLASQKNYMSLYMMSVYDMDGNATRFQEAWKKAGKKLDMGKCCIRFRKVEDLALDVLGQEIKRMPVKKYIAYYESCLKSLISPSKKGASSSRAKAKAKPAKKRTSKAR